MNPYNLLRNVMDLFRRLNFSLCFKSPLTAYIADNLFVRLNVGMECWGKDGNLKFRDEAPQPGLLPPTIGPDLGIVATCLVAGAVCLLRHPELLAVLPFCRVTTAGLNKYLDATLKTGLTTPAWYVFIIKAVASDGAITSGAAVLTSASNPFASGDVGRNIIVRGAGTAGADLYTTIASYTNAGSVTLTANAGTTVSSAQFAFECRAADTMSSHASFVEDTDYSNANRPTWTPGTIASGSVDNSASPAPFSMNPASTIYIFGAGLCDNNTKGGTTGTLMGAGVNSSGLARQISSGDSLNVTITPSLTAA